MFSVDRWGIFLNRKCSGWGSRPWYALVWKLSLCCCALKLADLSPFQFGLFSHIRSFPKCSIILTAVCCQDIYSWMHTETLMTTKSCQQSINPFSGSHHNHLCHLLVGSYTLHLFFFSHISLKQNQRWAGGFPLTEPWQELPEITWQRECKVDAAFYSFAHILAEGTV